MNVLEKFTLKGKVVLLTGGGGLYGRQLTRAIAEAGATLIVASRNVDKLLEMADRLNSEGFAVHAEQLDLASESSILGLLNDLLVRFGRIDGLVNNSVLRTMRGWEDSAEAWEQSMRVNATGLMLITRAFGKAMAAHDGEGSIVNIGSIQGQVGPSVELYEETDMGLPPPDYFFHKAGMANLTRYFAAAFGGDGVRVNCIAAGGFFNNQPAPFLDAYQKRTMLGRMAGDGDLAGPVIFLLSDASRYITGASIPVDGGYTAK